MKSSINSSSAALAVCVVVLAAAQAAALDAGDQPPAINLRDQAGKVVDLDNLKGKVVVVDFWASWCAPCRKEMPVLQKMFEKYKGKGLVVVGVNIDKSEAKMKAFLERVPVTFQIVHDKGLKVAAKYEPPMMPSSYFVGRDGSIAYVHRGFRKKETADIEARIQALLATP